MKTKQLALNAEQMRVLGEHHAKKAEGMDKPGSLTEITDLMWELKQVERFRKAAEELS